MTDDVEASLSKAGTSSPTGEPAMPVWSMVQSTIGSGPKSDALCSEPDRGCLEEVVGYWKEARLDFLRSGRSGRLSKQGSLNRDPRRGEFVLLDLRWSQGVTELWVVTEGSRPGQGAWSRAGHPGLWGPSEGCIWDEGLHVALSVACSRLGVLCT